MLASALKQRRDFSKWELVKAVEAFELDACSEETQQRSHRQLLEDLILHVFPGRPDLQAEIKAEYDKPPEVNHEDFEIDEEMQQLLMELAVTDHVELWLGWVGPLSDQGVVSRFGVETGWIDPN